MSSRLRWVRFGITWGAMLAAVTTAAAVAAAQPLVEAERAFAARSREAGMRAAFLEFLAEDGVIFRPGPVNGREAFRDRPDRGRLLWEPAYVEVAGSGDLGLSTGPWRFEPETAGATPVWGTFVSIWVRRDEGPWRVAADGGITHPEPVAGLARDEALADTVRGIAGPGAGGEQAEASLRRAEAAFASEASAAGAAAAYRTHGTADLRLLRDGAPPVVGRGEALRRLGPGEGGAGELMAAGVSVRGDLGYTYGSTRSAGADSPAHFLRAWRREGDGAWRIALDLLLPPPPSE